MKRFHVVACHVLWRELCHFAAETPHLFTFEFLRQGLHNEPDKLRQTVQDAIDAADRAEEPAMLDTRTPAAAHGGPPDALLLGYGLCSNGLMGVSARRTPLVVPRAHDCITLLLGSKERYRDYFDANPGTYWYSPGWIETSSQPGRERFERLRQQYLEKFGEENAAYLMQVEMEWVKKYSHATYVDLGLGEPEAYIRYTRECADYVGWEYDYQKGDPRLFRQFVRGDWPDEDFLVVQPGQTIAASHDNGVLKAVASESP